MANWYDTTFETKDKDIVEIIKNGRTIDFCYHEDTNIGVCRLAWGIGSIDMDKVKQIAEEHYSSFMISSSDILTGTLQEWSFENGVEVVAKVSHVDIGELI